MSRGRELHRLKVIFPERRREKRYLTLKNAGIAAIALVLAFVLLSVWSAVRPHSAASGEAISYREQASDSTSPRPEPMVVEEGSTNDHPGTDPRLLDAPAVEPATAEQTSFEHRTSQLGKGQRITISGGSGAVELHTEPIPPAAPANQTSATVSH
jgi:hypothetical protein